MRCTLKMYQDAAVQNWRLFSIEYLPRCKMYCTLPTPLQDAVDSGTRSASNWCLLPILASPRPVRCNPGEKEKQSELAPLCFTPGSDKLNTITLFYPSEGEER